MEAKRLSREHWLRAARRAMLKGGYGAASVEGLARTLGVTKGSFYWHFRTRAELLDELLQEWELETSELFARASAFGDVREGLQWLMAESGRRVVASERGDAPSDAAIFAWSATDPRVARCVAKVEEIRVAFLAAAVGSARHGELAYLCYLGFLDRRRRVPGMSARFGEVMQSMFDLVVSPQTAPAKQTA
jgi:AcrR family transcriptional regulator